MSVVDEIVEKMKDFIKEYNEAIEKEKLELRKKLEKLILECAEACALEKKLEKVYKEV